MDNNVLAQASKNLPEWNIVFKKMVAHLQREFEFDDFSQALDFVNSVGDIADAESHHPLVILEWGYVRISWWSNDVKGLTDRDLKLAAMTNELYE